MIFCFAGHNPLGPKPDPGAVGHGFREADCAIDQRNIVVKEIKALGGKVIIDDDKDRLADVLGKIKTGAGSVICEFHKNAGPAGATGVEVLIPLRHTTAEFDCAREIAAAAATALGLKLRGDKGVKTEADSQHKALAIMRPEGINILVESCFISNADDMKAWVKGKEAFGKAVAKILVKYDAMF